MRAEVDRLAAEGICSPADIAAVTDTYIVDADELSDGAPAAGRGPPPSRRLPAPLPVCVSGRAVARYAAPLCRTPLQLFPHICRGAAQRCPKTPLSPGLHCVLSHSQSLQLRESPGTMPPKCATDRPRPASAPSLRPAACCTLRPICIHASAAWRCGGVSRRWSSPRPPTDTSRGKMDRQSLLRRSIGVCFWSQEVLARQAPHRPPRRR